MKDPFDMFNTSFYKNRLILPANQLNQWPGVWNGFLSGVLIEGDDCFVEHCLVYRKDANNPFLEQFLEKLLEAELPQNA